VGGTNRLADANATRPRDVANEATRERERDREKGEEEERGE